jgi:rare lipoprotein A
MRTFWLVSLALVLGACSSTPPVPSAKMPPAATARGGYYLDDGPGENPPTDLDAIPDAVVRREPLHRFANDPYQVFGQTYTPLASARAYREEGLASWYGRRFHGRPTASGEAYDMYAMTGAHRTLPIPSYARVTALDSGRSVIVRINDRGPFHSDRLIDLTYTAAYKLGLVGRGSGRVRVEGIDPGAIEVGDAAPPGGLYLQFGAFGEARNAQQLERRIAAVHGDARPPLRVIRDGGLHRVAIGPYADEADAAQAGERLRASLGVVPVRLVR